MEKKKEVSLEEICAYAGKTPEQIINMLIAAGKVNRGHYKSFMKFEEDEQAAMRHRVNYNKAVIDLYNTNLQVASLNKPGFPKEIKDVEDLVEAISRNNTTWDEALDGAKAEVDALNKQIHEMEETIVQLNAALLEKKTRKGIFKHSW